MDRDEMRVLIRDDVFPKRFTGGFDNYMSSSVVNAMMRCRKALLSDALGLPIVFVGGHALSEKNKNRLQQIIRCGLLVIRNAPVYKRDDNALNEDLINFSLSPAVPGHDALWSDEPVFRCYYNAEKKLIADPEFLVLSWSKNLENFDTQNNALLPGLPRNPMTNSLLSYREVRVAIEEMLLEWQLTGRRYNKKILKTRDDALKCLMEAAPLLYLLMYDQDGVRIFRCAYEMQRLLDADPDPRQSVETRRACLNLYNDMLETIVDPQLKNHLLQHNRMALEFDGIVEPLIKTGCLLTNFATYYFFYLPPRPKNLEDPTENIYHMDHDPWNIIERAVTSLNKRRGNLYALDYDPQSRGLVYKVAPSNYHYKNSIGQGLYDFLLQNTEPYLFCNRTLSLTPTRLAL
jgi:hypothetical protein